jgi:hypothetical protein
MGADKAGRTVVLPKGDDDAEGLAAFRSKIGVPDTADGYQLPVPDGESPEFATQVSTWFHENGVPKAAAQAIAGKWNEFMKAEVEKMAENEQAASEKALSALKTEWGDAFDKRSEFGRRGLAAYGQKAGLDEKDLLSLETTIGTAKMLKLFHAIGETTAEGDFVGGDSQGFGLTPAQALAKLDEARQQRIEGKMTAEQFQAIEDRYGPIAYKAA